MKYNLLVCWIVAVMILSCKKDGKQNDPVPGISKERSGNTDPKEVSQSSARSAIGGDRICGKELAQFSFSGKTFSEAVDITGQWHNEYLEKVFANMAEGKIKPDGLLFKDYLHKKTTEIFAAKGIAVTDLPLSKKFNFLDPAVNIDEMAGYSAEAKEILKQLVYTVTTKCAAGDETVNKDFTSLKSSALNLPDQKEALSVGIAVSVAINSNSYWNTNAVRWFDYAGGTVGAKNKLGVGQLVKADVGGAIEGALYGGVGAGVVGAVAGAILTSSACSLLNCFSQALGWLVSWW